MPALVNMSVGSFLTTMGADGTIWCCFDLKNSRNLLRISLDVIIMVYRPRPWMLRGHQQNKRLIFAIYAVIFVSPALAGSKGKRESSIVKRQFAYAAA